MQVKRFEGNPILSPHPRSPVGRSCGVQPGRVVRRAEAADGVVLYRAAESGPDYNCSFGLATSSDGYQFERVSDGARNRSEYRRDNGATIQHPASSRSGESLMQRTPAATTHSAGFGSPRSGSGSP